MGERAADGGAVAVAAALRNATGHALTRTPVSPDALVWGGPATVQHASA
jgi:CO/xanthine dehydrogenase Mo-binding subunit